MRFRAFVRYGLGVGAAAIALAGLVTGAMRLHTAQVQLARLETDLAASKQRISRLELLVAGIVSLQERPRVPIDQPSSHLAGADDRPTDAVLSLSRDEMHLIRDYIKVPPPPAGAVTTISVGTAIPEVRLLPLPPQLVDKLPRLLGARFTTDRNGAIVIVRRGSRHANALILP